MLAQTYFFIPVLHTEAPKTYQVVGRGLWKPGDLVADSSTVS